jgi:hypothetical protein
MYCTVSTVSLSHIAQGLRRTRVEPVVAEDVDERHKSCPKKEIFIKKIPASSSIVLRSCFDQTCCGVNLCVTGLKELELGTGPGYLLCYVGVVL